MSIENIVNIENVITDHHRAQADVRMLIEKIAEQEVYTNTLRMEAFHCSKTAEMWGQIEGDYAQSRKAGYEGLVKAAKEKVEWAANRLGVTQDALTKAQHDLFKARVQFDNMMADIY